MCPYVVQIGNTVTLFTFAGHLSLLPSANFPPRIITVLLPLFIISLIKKKVYLCIRMLFFIPSTYTSLTLIQLNLSNSLVDRVVFVLFACPLLEPVESAPLHDKRDFADIKLQTQSRQWLLNYPDGPSLITQALESRTLSPIGTKDAVAREEKFKGWEVLTLPWLRTTTKKA